ncbi:hypothetical protein K1719_002789 [Acacia pycnantha]|nr:hypothetical protein K1719_002789 [Acacia pycnantha]
MGLPCRGEPIKININDQHSIYNDLRSVYKSIAYKKIGDWLEEKLDENFEFLFVLFALGTLLAPSASVYVSDRLLKLMAVTKDAIAHFDWSSFILQELCEEIQEFKKDSQKSKTIKTRTVGGCLYFLMLFCFQHFPLGDVIPSPHQSPMAFWTDKNVKRRVLVEKKSNKGLLLRSKPRQQLPLASVPPSTSFDPDTMLTHRHICFSAYNQPTTSDESDDDDGDGHDTEEGEHIVEGDDIIDIEEDTQHGEETPTYVDGGLGGEQEVKEPGLKLRRSQRVVIPSSVLKSPWIDPKRKSKGKRTYDEKDTLFEMCTKSVTRDEATEEFVDMHHYFLTREELQCLTPRSWINNKLMSMVAKTLVPDQLENGGVVQRHIFTASFMEKMINPKLKWTVEANVGEILPENVGYNIGDCDFIFGPTLFINNWFCYVLDTRTMVFYALDSLVEKRTYYRMQHEKENPTLKTTKKKKKIELEKSKELMANKVVSSIEMSLHFLVSFDLSLSGGWVTATNVYLLLNSFNLKPYVEAEICFRDLMFFDSYLTSAC